MKSILIVKTLFCPDIKQFNKSFDSTNNLINFIRYNSINNIYNIDILLIGWIKDDTHNIKINKLINNTNIFTNKYYIRLKINYGKYFMFKFINKYFNNHSYLLFLDHDIFLDSLTSSIFNVVSDIFESNLKINNKQIGIIAINHLEDLRHQISTLDRCTVINNNKLLYSSVNNLTSIALGCFFITRDCINIFNNIDMIGVYGLDDYHIQHKINNIDYIPVLLNDFYIIHPYDDNINYKLWKVNIVDKLINNNLNFYRTVEDSINFWNN